VDHHDEARRENCIVSKTKALEQIRTRRSAMDNIMMIELENLTSFLASCSEGRRSKK
jgi:hypothetical protein